MATITVDGHQFDVADNDLELARRKLAEARHWRRHDQAFVHAYCLDMLAERAGMGPVDERFQDRVPTEGSQL